MGTLNGFGEEKDQREKGAEKSSGGEESSSEKKEALLYLSTPTERLGGGRFEVNKHGCFHPKKNHSS